MNQLGGIQLCQPIPSPSSSDLGQLTLGSAICCHEWLGCQKLRFHCIGFWNEGLHVQPFPPPRDWWWRSQHLLKGPCPHLPEARACTAADQQFTLPQHWYLFKSFYRQNSPEYLSDLNSEGSFTEKGVGAPRFIQLSELLELVCSQHRLMPASLASACSGQLETLLKSLWCMRVLGWGWRFGFSTKLPWVDSLLLQGPYFSL